MEVPKYVLLTYLEAISRDTSSNRSCINDANGGVPSTQVPKDVLLTQKQLVGTQVVTVHAYDANGGVARYVGTQVCTT